MIKSINLEGIKRALSKLDSRFEENITLRMPLEQKWSDYLRFYIDGTSLNSKIGGFVKPYTNLGDPTLPTITNQAVADLVQLFLTGDWLELQPDGEYVTDLEICYAVKALIEKKLASRECGFEKAILKSITQLRLFGISAIQYQFCMQSSSTYSRKLLDTDGVSKLVYSRKLDRQSYQGMKFESVNMFNLYPDLLAQNTEDLNEVDLFYRYQTTFDKVNNDPRFIPEAPYLHEDLVIYRGKEGLDELAHGMISSRNHLNFDNKQNLPKSKEGVELRYAYVDSIIIDDIGYEDILCIYAKSTNSAPIPLLIQHNARGSFKDILICQDPMTSNPNGGLGSSAFARSYNSACWSEFLRAAEAYKLGKAVFPTEFVPVELLDSVTSLGIGLSEFKEKYNLPGSQLFYSAEKYGGGASGIFTPEENRAVRDIQLLSRSQAKAGAELQQHNVDSAFNYGKINTATETNRITEQQGKIQRVTLNAIAENWLKPAIEYALDDMQSLLRPEAVALGLTPETISRILGEDYDIELIRRYNRETREPLYHSVVVGKSPDGQEAMLTMSIDARTNQKIYYLNNFLPLKPHVKILVNNLDFNRADAIEKVTRLFDMIPSMPDEEAKMRAMVFLTEEYLELTQSPRKAEFIKIMKESWNKSNPVEEQAGQLQLAEQAAKIRKTEAEALEEESRADRQNLKNISEAQMIPL